MLIFLLLLPPLLPFLVAPTLGNLLPLFEA
jgi:hypothetical protein